jgi:hypothetical protein
MNSRVGEDGCEAVGRGPKGELLRLNKFKYRVVCIILEFIEYFTYLIMFVNIISFKCVKVLSFGLYFNDFRT